MTEQSHLMSHLENTTLKEVKTKYGYVLPEQSFCDLSFKWNNKDDEYVFDISENSKDGKIDIHNDMVKTDITLEKHDSKTNEPVENARFGFYSRDNIYDKNGNVIVAAGEKIATVTTDKEGKAKIPFDVPVMDEGYGKTEGNLNSGDYYFLEEVLATVITLTGKNIRYILNTRIRKPQLYQPRQ